MQKSPRKPSNEFFKEIEISLTVRIKSKVDAITEWRNARTTQPRFPQQQTFLHISLNLRSPPLTQLIYLDIEMLFFSRPSNYGKSNLSSRNQTAESGYCPADEQRRIFRKSNHPILKQPLGKLRTWTKKKKEKSWTKTLNKKRAAVNSPAYKTASALLLGYNK